MGKWIQFWLLGLIWGSSFLFIRISVEELNQFQVVFIRTAIAAVGLNLVLAFRGKHLPLQWKRLYPLIVLGLGNTAVPFLLITWGEKTVESGLAAVLQSTASLFSFIIAHFVFADERISLQKVLGITVGFVGVVILASRSWAGGNVVSGELLGMLAIVLASLFYASFTIYSRRALRDVDPVMISAGAMTFAAITTGVLSLASPLLGEPAPALASLSTNGLVAVLLLGFLNTLVAYLMYYGLVQILGAARTSMVTYIVPPVGLFLGVIFLDEVLDARLLLGAALIFIGIAVVNMRFQRRPQTMVGAAQQAK